MTRQFFSSWISGFFLALLSLSCLAGCDGGTPINLADEYEPVYVSYESLRAPVVIDLPQNIILPGKKVISGNYLYISEVYKGVHVVDYTDPANPVKLNFINILGNSDIVIKNNILYADSYTDLVIIDITNPSAPVEISRINDAFPYPYYISYKKRIEIEYYSSFYFNSIDISRGIATGWVATGNQKNTYSDQVNYSDIGDGSSRMKFLIVQQNYLYTPFNSSLKIWDIAVEANPSIINTIAYDNDLEFFYLVSNSIYMLASYETNIFDISNPVNPVHVSTIFSFDWDLAFYNLQAIDVNVAYFINDALVIYDVSTPATPAMATQFYLSNPSDLALDTTTQLLYLVDRTDGIHIYDTSGAPYIIQSAVIPPPTGDSLRVINLDGTRAIVTGDLGIYLYDITGAASGTMTLISTLPITQEGNLL